MKQRTEGGGRRTETGNLRPEARERERSTLDARHSPAATRRLARSRSYRPAGCPADGLPRFQVSAFSLVEVTIALGIAGFCLVVLLGLIPAGMRNASTATEQTAAVGLLGAVVADLRETPGSSNTSAHFGITIPASGSATTATNYFSDDGQTNARSQSRYGVESTVTPQPNELAFARILIYWPAMAASTNAKGSIESVVVLDRK